MKSLLAVSQQVVQDMGDLCHVSTDRDVKTIAARVEHEGISFLTISLPQFCKDFERSLEQGLVADDAFAGFRRRAGLPEFLRGFLQLVFDRCTGTVRDDADASAVLAVRQITLLCSKVQLECSERRTRAAFAQYVTCESEMTETDPQLLAEFKSVGARIFRDVFTRVDAHIYEGDFVGRHGPGATADRLRGNAKYDVSSWTRRLESVVPFMEHIFPNPGWYQSAQKVVLREPGDEMPVKVVSVPKTLKTPRIIAEEPTCMQFVQQGISSVLLDELSKVDYLWELIGWLDQTPNQRLAREGSIHGSLATLDLSEASDRVSNELVQALFDNHRWLSEAVQSSRSSRARVPGAGVIQLRKFASMGSALTFPVEAMVFFTILCLVWERQNHRRVTPSVLRGLRGSVRVYGDDIIVPVDMAVPTIEALESFGLVVNRRKTFLSGDFRESCGRDYFRGHDVSVVRVRRLLPKSRTDTHEIVSAVSLRNQFFRTGRASSTVDWLDRRIGSLLPVYPEVQPDSPVLGRHTWGPPQVDGLHAHYQVPFVKGAVVVPRTPISRVSGRGALVKFFLKPGSDPWPKGHLDRAGRADSVDIRVRKVPVR